MNTLLINKLENEYYIKNTTASGTDTYTIAETIPAAYTNGERFLITFTNANTGAATLNRNSLGAKDLVNASGGALASGQIVAGGSYLVRYNGTHYRILNITASASQQNADLSYYYQTDWIEVTSGDWNNTVSGGSVSRSQTGLDTTENCVGVLTLNSGTGTTDYAQISMSTNQVKIGTCAIVHKFRIALSALSDGTDTYTVVIGLGNNSGSADFGDGIYFRYTHSVNSGKWEAVTAASSSRTAADTGVAAGTTHSVFEVRVNQAGTSVTYYIDGVLVATITTNIPSTTIGFVHKIFKSAGTTERTVYEDWTDISITRTVAR